MLLCRSRRHHSQVQTPHLTIVCSNSNYCNRFILNGLVHANKLLGEQVFDVNDWKVIGEYVYDSDGSRHQAFYAPKHNIQYKDIFFRAEEKVKVEESLKYSAEDAVKLWEAAGLQEINHWTASSDTYSEYHIPGSDIRFSIRHTPGSLSNMWNHDLVIKFDIINKSDVRGTMTKTNIFI